jgi:hypothetical protein
MSRYLYSLFFSKKRDGFTGSLSSKLSKYHFTVSYKEELMNRQKLLISTIVKPILIKESEPLSAQSAIVPPVIPNPPEKSITTISVKPAPMQPSPSRDYCVAPTQPDTLFWCIYIIAYGYNDYLQIGYNYGIKELEIKKKIAEFISANPSKLKQTNYKVTNVLIQEIMSELLTSQKETSMNCLLAMTVFFNINLLILNPTQKLLIEFISNRDAEVADNEQKTFLLQKDSYGKYNVKEEFSSREAIEQLKSQKFVLEHYLKPLKASSSYKVDDLVKLATKMNIYEVGRKYKKGDLYELVNDACKF